MSATAEKTTPAAQKARLAELQDENGWPRIFTYSVQGKTIVGQFRRYVTGQDAASIGKGLYDFLMGVCGFIAEYGLVPPDGGFRTKWAEAADLIEELHREALRRAYGHSEPQRVYADGMTDLEVLDAIETLADEHYPACALGRADRRFNKEISVIIKLAEAHRFTLVPPGWRLTPTAGRQPETPEGPPASLADALHRLAQANGLTLIAPPPVDTDGQVRLM